MADEEAAREDALQPATPFTLVVSDVHAFPEFLENAVRRSGFRAGVDHLVFAGDLLGGVEQIAGHATPGVYRHWTEADFRAAGLYLIDPGSYGLGSRDHPRHYGYVVIRGGMVSVEAGTPDAGTISLSVSTRCPSAAPPPDPWRTPSSSRCAHCPAWPA